MKQSNRNETQHSPSVKQSNRNASWYLMHVVDRHITRAYFIKAFYPYILLSVLTTKFPWLFFPYYICVEIFLALIHLILALSKCILFQKINFLKVIL